MDKNKRLKRMGVMLALSIAIHNFPEGIAAFMSGMKSLDVGIPIALAIAIHNIPEGIAVSVPIYHATGSRKKAFWFSFLSGLAEPLGALVAILVLFPFWNPLLEGIVMAGVSGIMVFISIDELLPGAERFGRHHLSIMGFIAGMAVMAVSLLLL
jgi:ZIP family zinc transporter